MIIQEIQRLLLSGFENWRQRGEIYTKTQGDLVLFNYSPAAQYAAVWNEYEQVSRGLIINRVTGEIVARPFDKFFNWLEGGRKASGHIVNITEKIDGSLGILYRDNGYKLATRGSFDSQQAAWGTQFLQQFDLSDLPDELTLLFEIVYPENRIVVDYGDEQDLYLLAARNRLTGKYLPFFPDVIQLADKYGFTPPKTYNFNNIGEILVESGKIDVNQEGWVIEFSDGSRWKIKGDRYIEMHRLISSLSLKNTFKAVREGRAKELLNSLPDEFLEQVKDWIREIDTIRSEIINEVEEIFYLMPQFGTRKEQALWVLKNHKPIAPLLFAYLDEKEETPFWKEVESRLNAKNTESDQDLS